MENKKIGFFSRIKIAVAKLENYGVFLEEKIAVAVKYFFLIVLILSIGITAIQTYDMMRAFKKGYEYIQKELPDFTLENGNLRFSERIYAYDEEYDIYMIADTGEEVTEETLQNYKKEVKSTGFIFLKDKVIYKMRGTETEYDYSRLSQQYGALTLNKESVLQEIDKVGFTGITVTMFLVVFVSVYLVQLVSTLLDWIMIAIFALIVARVCRISMNLKHCFNISIYALTLSIILNMLYNIAYTMTGFYTEYFRLVYLLISYVYVIAVILMIKTDLWKQQMEVAKIVKVQKEIETLKETEEEEESKKENQKPEKDDDKQEENPEGVLGNNEPDGSEI